MNIDAINMKEYLQQNVPSYVIDTLASEFKTTNSISCLYAYVNEKYSNISDDVVSLALSQNEEDSCKKLVKVL